MNVELKGTIKKITGEEKINDKLTKQDVVVTIEKNTQYPQDIICQAINGKMEKVKNIGVGDDVIVKCNLKGRESAKGFFNRLEIWDIIPNEG